MIAGTASRLRTLLENEAKLTYVRLNPKRLAHLVALSRLTRGAVGGFFTLDTRFAFSLSVMDATVPAMLGLLIIG
jgi:hypothetical protein